MNIHSSGDGARIAGRDYYERGVYSPDDPEWPLPEADSGLIRCPRCRRHHLAWDADFCLRCGYPNGELLRRERRLEQWMDQLARQLRMLPCFVGFMAIQIIGSLYRCGLWSLPLGLVVGIGLFIIVKQPAAELALYIARRTGRL